MSPPKSSPPPTNPNLTSSLTGTLYLAFGSNLSPTQMRGRLSSSPSSSVPVAVARLDGWKWIICQRGYANVVKCPVSTSTGTEDKGEDKGNVENMENVVYGLVYNLSPSDESTLDLYEGHNPSRNPSPTPNPLASERPRKPHLQGGWDYNKLYLPLTITHWLVDPGELGLKLASEKEASNLEGPNKVRALVYVDEHRTLEGTIIPEYIGRMNRGIDEGCDLGVPRGWCEGVMRRWVTEGVYPRGWDVGTREGYVERG